MANLERNWVSKTMSGYHELDGAKVTQNVVIEISMREMMQFVSDNWMEIPVHMRENFKTKIQKLELGLETVDVHRPENDSRYW